MGLRRGDATSFFAARDQTGAILRERDYWLSGDPEKYAAITPAAEPALADTIKLAQSLGVSIDGSGSAWEQMLRLARHWESDFVWLHPDSTKTHRLIGGVVCFPSSWALPEKVGLTMSETHGPVPGLNAALDHQIEKFLAKMLPDDPWLRENVGYSRVPDRNLHPTRVRRPLDASVTAEEIWIRLEHQLLLKLLPSGSILFGIRVEVFPLKSVLEVPEIAARMARELASMSGPAAEYKALEPAREVLLQIVRAHQP